MEKRYVNVNTLVPRSIRRRKQRLGLRWDQIIQAGVDATEMARAADERERWQERPPEADNA